MSFLERLNNLDRRWIFLMMGLAVAVPFYHHTHGETHFRGEISAVRKSTYSVRFPEVGGTWSRPWTVQPNRLFHVAGA